MHTTLKIVSRGERQNSMWTSHYVKAHERGVLYNRDDFERILMPGLYRLPWFSRQRIVTYDLSQPEVHLPNLELLLQVHSGRLERHLQIVRTTFDQAALVRLGQRWLTVGPNQTRAFWRGFVEVEVHLFDLQTTLELPAEFIPQLRGSGLDGVIKYQVGESEVGLLFVDGNFVRPLQPGDYAFWTYNYKVAVRNLSRLIPNPSFPQEDALIEQHPEFVATYAELVQVGVDQVALVRFRDKVIALLPPNSRKLFWQGISVEMIDLTAQLQLPQPLVAELVFGHAEVLQLTYEVLHMQDVPPQHLGLLYLDGQLQTTLPPGLHVWWKLGHTFKSEAVDLRLQTLEVSGQEILSKDKVPLRLNLTAGYKVTDVVRAKSELVNISDFLYKELQFALRSAVGTRSLDALLEDKGAIDTSIAEYIREKAAPYGLEIESVGVKDIILPGEIKAILSKVVEAEKAAQANVVRRREETAATRSMLNTAKVMEDNPVALRLKELEVLERIAEKIEHIHVNGGLESILTELIRIKEK